MKNKGKSLYAIFKKEIHKGNSYGIDEKDAIISHLKKAQFPITDKIIDEYVAVKAIENIHFFKSKSVIIP